MSDEPLDLVCDMCHRWAKSLVPYTEGEGEDWLCWRCLEACEHVRRGRPSPYLLDLLKQALADEETAVVSRVFRLIQEKR